MDHGILTISSSETGYTLYYQGVEISDTVYSEIQKTQSDGETELKNIENTMNTLKSEYQNLKTIYDKAYEDYKNATEEEKEQAEEAYKTALTNYENKVKEYNNKVNEYKTKSDEISAKIKDLTPTYVESNWIKTTDNKFAIDSSKFSGKKAFAVWAKLVSSDGTISYDEATYTVSGTKVADVKVESITLDKTSISINEGDSYTLTATITPSNSTNKSVDWSSDNEKIAKVENGKVIAISEGSAIITATTKDGSYKASCTVTVTKKSNTEPATKDEGKTEIEDKTTANGKLPQTGSSAYFIILAIASIGIVSFALYKKVKFLRF